MSAWKVCACAIVLALVAANAEASLIDSFTAGKQSLSVSPDATTDSNQANPGTSVAIGGYRDIALKWLSGDLDFANTLTTGGKFAFTQGTSEGEAAITWDGANTQGVLSYALGTDLTSASNNEFLLNIITTTGAGMGLTMTVYSDATHASSYSTTVPAAFSGNKAMLYSGFSKLSGAAGPANFASVGAIVLDLKGTGYAGSDITLGTISTAQAVPEPPVLAFTIMGAMVAIWGWRRIR
jgi:hypothetical protein